MLEEENRQRLSEPVQRLYAQAEESGTYDWMRVTEVLQAALCKAFGYGIDSPAELERALWELRTGANRFDDLRSIPLYYRYNRARDGDLKEGDTVPPIPLLTLEGEPLSLSQLEEKGLPLVVFAGSIT